MRFCCAVMLIVKLMPRTASAATSLWRAPRPCGGTGTAGPCRHHHAALGAAVHAHERPVLARLAVDGARQEQARRQHLMLYISIEQLRLQLAAAALLAALERPVLTPRRRAPSPRSGASSSNSALSTRMSPRVLPREHGDAAEDARPPPPGRASRQLTPSHASDSRGPCQTAAPASCPWAAPASSS